MVKILGHRGNPAEYADNSFIGITSAAEICDGVEVDFRRCATGELVLAHDRIVDGLVIADTPLELLLSRGVTSADDLFDADIDTMLDLEVKNWPFDPGFEPGFAIGFDVARQARDSDVVTSFHWPTVDAVRSEYPNVHSGLLFEADVSWTHALAHAVEHDHRTLAPHHRLIDEVLVEAAHAAGVAVAAWTVDARSEFDRLARLGTDTIITNTPALAVGWMKEGAT